jgi:hypothetical protein
MPRLATKKVDNPIVEALQKFFGEGPEDVMGLAGPMSMGPATIRMAMKSAPGFSKEAWKGSGGIQKFLADLPEIFDYILPEGIKATPERAFRRIKEKGRQTVIARGDFMPPNVASTKYQKGPGQIRVREEAPEGLFEAITPEKQGFTARHEMGHAAQGLSEAIEEYVKRYKRPPSSEAEKMWEQVKRFYPLEKGYIESQADVIANRLAKSVPLEYGASKGLTHYESFAQEGPFKETLSDLLRLIKLGSLY